MVDIGETRRAPSRNQGLAARAALAIIFALVGLWPAASGAQAAAGAVTLYADTNYTGQSMPLSGDVARLSSVNFNDVTSSLRVSTGTRVAAYADANYNGACEEFVASDGDLRNNRIGNDRISSLRLNQGCPAQLFADLGYSGDSRVVRGGILDLGALGFDNAATSLSVPAGTTLTAYSDPNYGGICQEFTAADGDLRNNPVGNDRISSVRLNTPCPPQATLFTATNYGGDYRILAHADAAKADALGWATFDAPFYRQAKSIYLTGGLTITTTYFDAVYPTWGQACENLYTSDPDLRDNHVTIVGGVLFRNFEGCWNYR